ncbi:hypothetical protein NLJ89_g6041 [Agrocybe chaxingu]|uniref:Uncharacterized protein n=1 Tax=Agrocybe chaxingu TaxID=84603 RepID=A0A9W8K032_9AGAR|nr:hypothetical protein NLJ89_g6041 [Agrocybe chaxingu]
MFSSLAESTPQARSGTTREERACQRRGQDTHTDADWYTLVDGVVSVVGGTELDSDVGSDVVKLELLLEELLEELELEELSLVEETVDESSLVDNEVGGGVGVTEGGALVDGKREEEEAVNEPEEEEDVGGGSGVSDGKDDIEKRKIRPKQRMNRKASSRGVA